MGKCEKLITGILSGNKDNNINFRELCGLMKAFGFSERIKGGHFIYYKKGFEKIINLQPLDEKAKSYQVKQIRELIILHKLEVNRNV